MSDRILKPKDGLSFFFQQEPDGPWTEVPIPEESSKGFNTSDLVGAILETRKFRIHAIKQKVVVGDISHTITVNVSPR